MVNVDLADLMPLLRRLVQAIEGIWEELIKLEEAIRDTSPGGR